MIKTFKYALLNNHWIAWIEIEIESAMSKYTTEIRLREI